MRDPKRYQEKVGGGNPSASHDSVTDAPSNTNSASGITVNTGPTPTHTQLCIVGNFLVDVHFNMNYPVKNVIF